MKIEKITLGKIKKENYDQVRKIYQQGIDTGNASFQKVALDFKNFDTKYLATCRLAALEEDTDKVLGWAALLPVSTMDSYRGVAELSLYVAEEARGRGVGKFLMEQLIEASEKAGFWTLQSLIFPENEGSLALHHAFGFKTLCIHELLGEMDGVFRDVARLERRSSKF
ncbi:GNAT family N-acetyltransferase [Listeria valentina]|uniref:GNAT family N-acetyltransferase n=1 Tax=Listeria valentina TaxID=2705293 RepID=UPI001431439A|nr:GNAT family N-acetyltransferase [Listeria valentina]